MPLFRLDYHCELEKYLYLQIYNNIIVVSASNHNLGVLGDHIYTDTDLHTSLFI